jgi:predicted AlkP superfamily phosphohydrolase/phosphomutase
VGTTRVLLGVPSCVANDRQAGKQANMSNKKRKLLVLGLDGATFDILNPLLAQGVLPNIELLIQRGCHSNLNSTIQPFSAQAWSSFMTGMNPGKHGILDFTEHCKEDYTIRFINASYRRGKTLWRLLSDYGKDVGVVNVPFTYPPEEIKGFSICGMDAPGLKDEHFYPKDLYGEIMSEAGKYLIEINARDYIRSGKLKQFLKKIQDLVDMQFRAVKYLIEKKPWDFFMYVFRATDQVQHYFWRYLDPNHPLYSREADDFLQNAISRVYRQIDDYIGQLLTIVGDRTTVIIMSDHGQGGNSDKALYLNKWLCSLGLLEFKSELGARAGTMDQVFTKATSSEVVNSLKRVIPRNVKNLLLSKAPFLKDKMESHASFSGIDWLRTKAYSEEDRGNIWINLKGCQQQGIVKPGREYEEVCDRLIKELLNMSDPETGKRIVKQVFKKEDIYEGPYLKKAPDILFLQNSENYSYIQRKSDPKKNPNAWIEKLTTEEADQLPSASHRVEGILIAKGEGIKSGAGFVQGANIVDVAPTILHMMDLPIPREMDGEVLKRFMTDEFLEEKEISYSSGGEISPERKVAYSPHEEDVIKERLRGLGYLE